MATRSDPLYEPHKELWSDKIQCQKCAQNHHHREQQKEETTLAGAHIILIIGKDVECTIRCPQYRKDWDVIVSHHPQLRERYVKTLLIESYTYGAHIGNACVEKSPIITKKQSKCKSHLYMRNFTTLYGSWKTPDKEDIDLHSRHILSNSRSHVFH